MPKKNPFSNRHAQAKQDGQRILRQRRATARQDLEQRKRAELASKLNKSGTTSLGKGRTLTPELLMNHRATGQDLILNYGLTGIGKRKQGITLKYTAEDLDRFWKSTKAIEKQFKNSYEGVYVRHLLSASTHEDIERSQQQIKRAMLYRTEGNLFFFNVSGSGLTSGGKPSYHVKIRLLSWELEKQKITSKASYAQAVEKIVTGRVAIDCECERYRYWYRYLATVGRFALKPYLEHSFPKITNPSLTGACCKHQIKALQVLQSATVRSQITQRLQQELEQGFSASQQAFLSEIEQQASAEADISSLNVKRLRKSFFKDQKKVRKLAQKSKKLAKLLQKSKLQSQEESEKLGKSNQTLQNAKVKTAKVNQRLRAVKQEIQKIKKANQTVPQKLLQRQRNASLELGKAQEEEKRQRGELQKIRQQFLQAQKTRNQTLKYKKEDVKRKLEEKKIKKTGRSAIDIAKALKAEGMSPEAIQKITGIDSKNIQRL